jgi:hypothetical protein
VEEQEPEGQAPEGLVFQRQIDMNTFLKGNTHIHTENSEDAQASVEDVAAWYRNHGYDFIVLTDHNISYLTDDFSSEGFTVIPGEEVSSYGVDVDGKRRKVHVNNICSSGITIGGTTLDGIDVALKDAVDRIIGISGGIPQINHPNFLYSVPFKYSDILFAYDAKLIEIANQHFAANNSGDENYPTVEFVWDQILGEGMLIYGVASDDTHDISDNSKTPPGKGWIQVASSTQAAQEICEAIASGSFYASTGVELTRIAVTHKQMRLTILPRAGEAEADYVTTFSADNGSVLKIVTGSSPRYDLSGCHSYVRAKVDAPDGTSAWIQPFLIAPNDNCADTG